MLRIFNCFKSKVETDDISVFSIKIDLSFRGVAQVSYKNENSEVKIVRFHGSQWSRDILKYTNDLEDINFKFFVHTPNIKMDESVTMSIEYNNRVVLSQKFKISKEDDFAGWFTLLPVNQANLFDNLSS